MMLRALVGLLSTMLALACGGDDTPAGGTDGSTTATPSTSAPGTSDPTTGEATTTGSTTSDPADTTTDPDGSSGGPPTGTPGCGMEAAAGLVMAEIQVDATLREYLLVIPDGYDPSTPMPLVFGWHGLGSSADVAHIYFQIEQASDDGAIFVYPQGLPIASEGGQSGWDVGPDGADVRLFDAILEELSASLCIDRERVFSTGHSFGGYMSNALGCFRPSVLRAIAPVAGIPPFEACEPDTVAAWLAHGMSDEVVPFAQGEAARDALLERNGCDATSTAADPTPCVAYDGCDEGMPVVWCAHDEATLQGHMWPRFAGPAIWAFFDGLPPKG